MALVVGSLLCGSLLAIGCTARPAPGDSDGGAESTTDAATGDVDAADDATEDGPDFDGDGVFDEGLTSGAGDDCGSFLGCDDIPDDGEMCDFWAQDCQDGEKCTAIASSPGSGAWDANVCVPAGTAAIGEPCTVEDGPQGTDSCDDVSICLDIDPNTGVGRCVGFCLGPEQNPTCPEGSGPGARCRLTSQGVLNVCLAPCNPLLDDACPAGQVCVPAFEGGVLGTTICFPPAAEGTPGDECSCANCCAAGHMCVLSEDYGPGCAFDACCTEYCDVNDSTFSCQDTNQVCIALFDPTTPGIGNVGRCVVQ